MSVWCSSWAVVSFIQAYLNNAVGGWYFQWFFVCVHRPFCKLSYDDTPIFHAFFFPVMFRLRFPFSVGVVAEASRSSCMPFGFRVVEGLSTQKQMFRCRGGGAFCCLTSFGAVGERSRSLGGDDELGRWYTNGDECAALDGNLSRYILERTRAA